MKSSHGIVLHTIRYNDTQFIVNVFTEQAGMVPFLLRSRVRTGGSRQAARWQPLALVEVAWEPHELHALQRPTEFGLWQPWTSLPFHPHKMAMALCLGEFLSHALRHEAANPLLFGYIVQSLQWLDTSETHFANFHVVFLLRLTQFLGFYPNVECWHPGSFFDMRSATFVDGRPPHPNYINPEEAALVPKFLRMDMRKMKAVGLNGAIRTRALSLITEFYRLHVPEFPDIKSIAVLSEVFG